MSRRKNELETVNTVHNTDTDRTPIEIALQIDDEGMTTASKLYEFLELDVSNFSKWCKRNIENNNFALENTDYFRLVVKYESASNFKFKTKIDYKITSEFAKKLSMTGNTERHEQARQYFIACEQGLKVAFKKLQENNNPTTMMNSMMMSMIAENNKMLLSTMLSMQEQSNKMYEILTTMLNENKPKEVFKSVYMPAWVSKMFSKFTILKDFYYPEDEGYTNIYRKIFSEFSEAYGSELLAQTVDDFCYRNNCKKCGTMDAIAYNPDVRKVMEMFIDDMLFEINSSLVDEVSI